MTEEDLLHLLQRQTQVQAAEGENIQGGNESPWRRKGDRVIIVIFNQRQTEPGQLLPK